MKNAARIRRIKQDLTQTCNDVSFNEFFRAESSAGSSRPTSRENTGHHITNFEEINLADPFPTWSGSTDTKTAKTREIDAALT